MKGSIRLAARPWIEKDFPRMAYLLALLADRLAFPINQMLISMAQKNLVNAAEYQEPSRMGIVAILSAVIIMNTLVINPAAEYIRDRCTHILSGNLRRRAINQLLYAPLSFLEKFHSGDLLTRIDSDLNAVKGFYGWSCHRFLLAVFYGGGSIVLMAFLCWPLAVLIFLMAAAETWLMEKLSVKIREGSEMIQEHKAGMNSIFLDISRCLRCIRMLSAGNLIMEKYRERNRAACEASVQRGKADIKMAAVSDAVEAINLLSVFSCGLLLYFSGFVDLGSVMSFLILQDGVSYMFTNLRDFFSSFQQSLASFQKFYHLLDGEREPIRIGAAPQSSGVDIRLEQVSYQYPGRDTKALKNISCLIPAGHVTALMGTSGSGKTTLARLLLGFCRPDTGTIEIGGADSSRMDQQEIRSYFSYVPQAVYIFQDTVEENIRCGCKDAPFEKVEEAAKLAGADLFIRDLPKGYQTGLSGNGSRLSGGQKQRIALARAFLRDTPAVILDEPSSALDPMMEGEIFQAFRTLAAKGKTVLLIAHRSAALDAADNALFLTDGWRENN